MELGNWDDDDFVVPTSPGPANMNADDLFEFTESLRISDDEGDAKPDRDLPPLPEGTRDLSGDRGVLMEMKTRGIGHEKPSKEMQYVEIHYEGFLVATGEKFDTSRDQNYALIVQLDIPPTGNSSVIRGLEIGLREVMAGDVVTMLVGAKYGYGKEGELDIPPDSDLRFEVEVLDVRATHKKVFKVDSSKNDLSRLDEIKKEREMAQQRRQEEEALKEEERKKKAQRVEQLRAKLANKNKGGKKGKKKK